MDWTNNKSVRPSQANVGHNPEAAMPHSGRSGRKNMRGFKMASVALLFSISVLILALVGYLVFNGNNGSQEKKYVDSSKYQAVFINGGQVYFGHIQALNNKYLSLADIYYLRVNQQVQPKSGSTASNNVSLVKLGCELHGPEDRMTINRDQVTFWENLRNDGQVAKAVAAFKKANPNGQNCTTQASTNSSTTTTP